MVVTNWMHVPIDRRLSKTKKNHRLARSSEIWRIVGEQLVTQLGHRERSSRYPGYVRLGWVGFGLVLIN